MQKGILTVVIYTYISIYIYIYIHILSFGHFKLSYKSLLHQVKITMASVSITEAEHLPHHHKAQGSNPAATAGIGKENISFEYLQE
jgi:hypothetical protein